MSCLLLPSQSRRRRTLPPHGYEGRRATPLPVPAPLESRPLPSEEAMAAAGLRFEAVGVTPGPVRLWHGKFSCGVFMNRAAAAPAIFRLLPQ